MSTNATKELVIPKECPPILAELLKKAGSGTKAARMIGQQSSGGISQLATGKTELTENMRLRIEAALRDEKVVKPANAPKGKSKKPNGASPPPIVEAAAPAPPPFEEWDGKFVPVKVRGKGGQTEKIKRCPGPLAKLLDRFAGNRLQAAQAIGYVTGTALSNILSGDREFDQVVQRKVYKVLNGLPVKDQEEVSANDTFNLGLAICLTNLSNYERLEDLAEVMGGALLMRRSVGSAGWLIIWRFPKREATQTFKRLGERDAKDIVCP